MRLISAVIGLLVFVLGVGAAQAAAETMRFAIMRNGQQIGTHAIEINRSGQETSVAMVTDLNVKVAFFTAYYMQQTENERWVKGRLVALNSTSDNNGTRHTVSAAPKGTSLEVRVDGKATLVDPNITPANFWSSELLGRPVMLDTKDGQVMPVSVQDGGEEELTINSQTVKAHRYTITGKYSQDLWFDDQSHLVQAKFVASDGSIIMYSPF
jgi:hypothetical protein